MATKPLPSIIVVGAGPVGLCVALALARAGHEVRLVDSGARGAGWASGGMLGAVFETLGRADVPKALTDLAFTSLNLWADLAKDIGSYASKDSLFIARHAQEADHFAHLAKDPSAGLSPSPIPNGMNGLAAWQCDHDITLNPRATLNGLKLACAKAGVVFVTGQVSGIKTRDIALADGARLTADVIILATGQGGAGLAASVPELAHISPVKGQMLALAGVSLERTMRAGRLYLLPRDGQIVVGATSSPDDVDAATLDPIAHADLHQDALNLWPALARATVVESWAGLRPMTPDHLPMIGPSRVEGVYLACGTYRNGWLLAPAIGQAMVDLVRGKASVSGDLQCFSPQRFPI
jgi:glycine oxidase